MLECTFAGPDSETRTAACTLHIKGAATIECCEQLRTALLDALLKSQSLVIDVSQVTAIDVSGLQLLCAAHKSAILQYKCLSLGTVRSRAFLKHIEEAGFHCTLPATCLKNEGQTCLWYDSGSTGNWEAL